MKLFRQDMHYMQRLTVSLTFLQKTLLTATLIFELLKYIQRSTLLNRTQHWYHTPPDTPKPLSREDLVKICRNHPRTPTGVAVLCQHLYSNAHDDELWDFQNQENNPAVRRCQRYALDYRYDWYDVGEHGSGLMFSIWRDFGRCLTPFDPRWTAHFEASDGLIYIQRDEQESSSLTAAPNSKE
jgi:hypothetical protein